MKMRTIANRTLAVGGVLAAATGLAAVAGAQTVPGRGPLASGILTNVSGSTLELQRTNPQDQSQTTTVSVTLTGSTTYQKVQPAAADAIADGACVRVAGRGSVDQGKITARTVAITTTSSNGCARPGGVAGGAPGSGPGGGGTVVNGSTANGSNAPSGSTPRNGARRAGVAFGSVQSVKGDEIVVKAMTFSRRAQSGGSQTSPRRRTKNVKVTLSSSTTVTQLVPASPADLVTGQCVSAAGTGDPEAVTADRVTISQPDNGTCRGAGFGGGATG